MILGTGLDLMDVERIRKSLEKPHFRARIFSQAENEYIDRRGEQSAAGIFAAKEALGKAMGHGLASFSVRDAEVLHNEFGAPYFSFNNGLFENFDISLSISHDGDYALAFVVLQER